MVGVIVFVGVVVVVGEGVIVGVCVNVGSNCLGRGLCISWSDRISGC